MDSSQPDGLLRFNRLVANADAVLVSGSPRSIEERELTHAALAAVNPRVVVDHDHPVRDDRAAA